VRLLFDIETTPIPADPRAFPDRIHCGVAIDLDTHEVLRAGPEDMQAFVAFLARADLLVGHNIAAFDVPTIQYHYPELGARLTDNLYDTLRVSQQVYRATLATRSYKMRSVAGQGLRGPAREQAMQERLPAHLVNAHSLEAWGYRLFDQKGLFGKKVDNFHEYSPQMLDYCEQDARLNVRLFHHLQTDGPQRGWPPMPLEAAICESRFAYILNLQYRTGVGFDEAGAGALLARLTQRFDVLKRELRTVFPDWYVSDGEHVPKRTQRSKKAKPGDPGFVNTEAGCAYTRIVRKQFNPSSRHHIADRLQKVFGWVPTAWGEDGIPTVNGDTLSVLPYPPMPQLLEALMLDKRIGQIANGKQAWLKNVTPRGLIHGRVQPSGTRTSRCTHSNPNLAQVPNAPKPFWEECRALFRPVRPDMVQVGCDAKKLELHMLGNRLYYYDGGAFAKRIHEDADSLWPMLQAKTGLFFSGNQKRATYGQLYGAGDPKLGMLFFEDWVEAVRRGLTTDVPPAVTDEEQYRPYGARIRRALLEGLVGMEYLLADCKEAFERGYVYGLDGRIIVCETEHGALNDVLQGDGACVMKHAAIIAHRELCEKLGPPMGVRFDRSLRWCWMLNIHDEWQLGVVPEHAEAAGVILADSIAAAGAHLELNLPLSGDWKVGANWKETH